ncbi:hypothetical protein FQA39_LY12263 [Lamprigera yunnana]|nr:hypothetical protein FQA39_LY12263 [Lamprigera yunnana]
MSWSRDKVGLLIDEYKKYPCLYATKSKEYKNKRARGRALQNIETELRMIKPNDVTANDIKIKFHDIKTNFLADHRKHAKSIHSGVGDDDLQEDESSTYEVENVNTLQFVESNEVGTENSNDEGVPLKIVPKRRKMDRTNVLDNTGKSIKLVGEAVQQHTQNKKISRDEVDIFGDFVSSQLRKIHPALKDVVEQEISMVLFNNIKKSKQLYNNETVFLD